MEKKKKNKQNRCFVPCCTSRYASNNQKVSLFSVPKDPELLAKWNRLIPHHDKDLDENCRVCELHFYPESVERNFCVVVQGRDVLIPRDRPKLKSDALPMLFPNLPFYLSKALPKRRRTRNSGAQASGFKENKLGVQISTVDVVNDTSNASSSIPSDLYCEESNKEPDCSLESLLKQTEPPTSCWSLLKFRSTPDTVMYVSWERFSEEVTEPDKKLIVKECSGHVSCTAYFKGVLVETKTVSSSDELHHFLSKLDGMHTCKGVGLQADFCAIPSYGKTVKALKTEGDIYRSSGCLGCVNLKGLACTSCKHLRKCLFSYKSKQLETKCNQRNSTEVKVAQQTAKRLKSLSIRRSNKFKRKEYHHKDALKTCLIK